MTLILAAASLIAGFGSSFQYGYNVAVVNSPAPVLTFILYHIISYYITLYYIMLYYIIVLANLDIHLWYFSDILIKGDAAVLHPNIWESLWSNVRQSPDPPVVRDCVHVPTGWVFRISHGSSIGEQIREVISFELYWVVKRNLLFLPIHCIKSQSSFMQTEVFFL